MTVVATRAVSFDKTPPSNKARYLRAVLSLLDVREQDAHALAVRLTCRRTVFSAQPLDLRPKGASALQIAGYRDDLLNRPSKALEARFKLEQAMRNNKCRRLEFRRWLTMASGLPPRWIDRMVDALRPEVTYVRFMDGASQLLIEVD